MITEMLIWKIAEISVVLAFWYAFSTMQQSARALGWFSDDIIFFMRARAAEGGRKRK